MPSEKYKRSSFRHAAKSFFGNFSSVSPYSFGLSLSPSTFTLLEDSDAASQADRRSAHNALERQRRENLNIKFQELAHALPSLQTIRRPSKTMIVAKSLEFVTSSLNRESSYKNEISDLRKQNEQLRKQASTISSAKLNRRTSPPSPPDSKAIGLPSPPQQPMSCAKQQQQKQQKQKQKPQQQQQQQARQRKNDQQRQQGMEDAYIAAAANYHSWMAATTMPNRDYCLFDNEPAWMTQSTMYQRDPLLTTVPPPYYYQQPMTMNPSMMLATAPPPPSAADGSYHSIVSGSGTSNTLA
ncbi:hypothetical protein BJV82DRAFT_589600 [Fennellomyces sp. T-0311]|nr:hypothetical protein BJV82DRAFT_589600 [Fennellomyces sp. T-0311]